MLLQPDKIKPIDSILAITIGSLVLFVFTTATCFLWITLVIGLIGLCSKCLTNQVHYVWMKIAWLLSLVVPKILLTLVFYVLLFPLALLSRVFGKQDPMQLRKTNVSLFKTVNRELTPESFKNPW